MLLDRVVSKQYLLLEKMRVKNNKIKNLEKYGKSSEINKT
jgi:hypothetical protein